MIKKFVRFKCRPQVNDDPYSYTLMLEALLIGDNLHSMPWLGFAERNGRYPFLLHLDGRIDFGAAYHGESRFWRTTLRNKVIRSGEVFSIFGTDENYPNHECMYTIFEVSVLLTSGTGEKSDIHTDKQPAR